MLFYAGIRKDEPVLLTPKTSRSRRKVAIPKFLYNKIMSCIGKLSEEPFEISSRLDHETVNTTSDTYGHLYLDKDIKLTSRINELKRE